MVKKKCFNFETMCSDTVDVRGKKVTQGNYFELIPFEMPYRYIEMLGFIIRWLSDDPRIKKSKELKVHIEDRDYHFEGMGLIKDYINFLKLHKEKKTLLRNERRFREYLLHLSDHREKGKYKCLHFKQEDNKNKFKLINTPLVKTFQSPEKANEFYGEHVDFFHYLEKKNLLYKKQDSKSMSAQSSKGLILNLFNQGNDCIEIRNKTNFKISEIKSTLRESQGKLFKQALDTLELREFFNLEESFVTFFNDIYGRLPNNIYKDYSRFFPPCLYLFFKLNAINISLLDLTYLKPKKEIRLGVKVLLKLYPEYFKRDRYQLILLKITRLIETFQLDLTFTNVSNRLLGLLYNKLNSASDGTIAGSIYLLASILLYQTIPTLNEVCSYLHIRPGTPYNQLKRLEINNVDFNNFNGLKKSTPQIRKLFSKDKELKQYLKFSRYYYVCHSCYTLNKGQEFKRQSMIIKCNKCGESFPKCIKSKRNQKLVDFWIKDCFYSVLRVIEALCIMLNKTKQSLTENDLQLVYGIRKYTQVHFGIYKNMKTLITKDFQWKPDVKLRINTIIAKSKDLKYYREFCLPNFETKNRDFIYGKSNYFFIPIESSIFGSDFIKYRYFESTGKTMIIFQFHKLFTLQETYKTCSNCLKPYLKEYKSCPVCRSIPKNYKLDNQTDIVSKDQLEKINYLKNVIKELTADKNKRLLEKSGLKIVGFSLQDFYDNYVYIPKGSKPNIMWSDNELLNKTKYRETLGRLERQDNLVKLFYDTQQWKIRKTEILERDNDTCSICKRPSNGVHHRLSATYNPEICLDPRNLITICKRCHKQINEN